MKIQKKRSGGERRKQTTDDKTLSSFLLLQGTESSEGDIAGAHTDGDDSEP